jgi:hypothetical protein
VHPHKSENMLATVNMANTGVTGPPSAAAGPRPQRQPRAQRSSRFTSSRHPILWSVLWIWVGANIAPINRVLGALGIGLGIGAILSPS